MVAIIFLRGCNNYFYGRNNFLDTYTDEIAQLNYTIFLTLEFVINKLWLYLTFLYAICRPPSLVYLSPLDIFPSSMGSMQIRTSSFCDKANLFLLQRFRTRIFPFRILEEAASDQNFWNKYLRWRNTSKGDDEDAS